MGRTTTYNDPCADKTAPKSSRQGDQVKVVTTSTKTKTPAQLDAEKENAKIINVSADTTKAKEALQFPKSTKDAEHTGLIGFRQIEFSVWEKQLLPNDISTAIEESGKTISDYIKKFGVAAGIPADVKATTTAARTARLSNTIILPLPNTLRDSQNHGWTVEKGVIGSIVGSLTDEKIGSILSSAGSNSTGDNSFFPKNSIVGNALHAFKNQIAKRTSDVSIDQMLGSASAMMGFRKPLADPGYFQNYTGSRPRQFTMSWELMPKNTTDADEIFSIIKSFKYYSSPSIGIRGVTLQAPHFFTLKITNGILDEMIAPGHMVITDISVDYAPDGSMGIYVEDGFPKSINLSLTLEDVRMRTSEDYEIRRKETAK